MIASMPSAAPVRKLLLAVSLPGFLLLAGCGKTGGQEDLADSTAAQRDSAAAHFAPPPPPPDTAVHQPRYRAVRIPTARALVRLRKELGGERFLLVLKVNRRDSSHVRDGDSLMVPVDSTAGLLALAPFPREVPVARDRAKLMLVSRRVQAFAAYETGRLVRWGPTSTGRESLQTPEGLFHTNWKDKERTSTFNDEWLLKWYVNLENFLGISFHQFDLPGHPASHSCIRLLEDDAMWLYDWAEQWKLARNDPRVILKHGTPVVVFAQFAYGKKSPWRRLAVDSTVTNVPLGEIEAALRTYLPRASEDSLPRPLAALDSLRPPRLSSP